MRCPEQATIKMPPKEEIQWDPRAEVWEGLPQRDSLLNKVFAKGPLARFVFAANCSSGQEDMRSDYTGNHYS